MLSRGFPWPAVGNILIYTNAGLITRGFICLFRSSRCPGGAGFLLFIIGLPDHFGADPVLTIPAVRTAFFFPDMICNQPDIALPVHINLLA
jgi:hypothetical protein